MKVSTYSKVEQLIIDFRMVNELILFLQLIMHQIGNDLKFDPTCFCTYFLILDIFYWSAFINVSDRTSPAEFIVPYDQFMESMKNKYSIGMRFKMKFEGEEAPEQRYGWSLYFHYFYFV